MSDYGRYESDTRTRNYGGEQRSRGYSRNSDSIFNQGDWRRDDDRHRERGRSSFGGERDRERDWNRDRDRERSYGSDDYREGLPVEETSRLIASNKVEGTAVYGSDGERLGSIYNFMVNKRSGRVEYAVMSYGGFLGMGQRYYPLPWRMLTYDTREGGYRINLTERDLRDAPSFDRNSEPRFDRSYGEHVHGWYGLDY